MSNQVWLNDNVQFPEFPDTLYGSTGNIIFDLKGETGGVNNIRYEKNGNFCSIALDTVSILAGTDPGNHAISTSRIPEQMRPSILTGTTPVFVSTALSGGTGSSTSAPVEIDTFGYVSIFANANKDNINDSAGFSCGGSIGPTGMFCVNYIV